MFSMVRTRLVALSNWFWNDDIWLPPGMTWADVRDTSKVNYAQMEQLWHSAYVAIILLFIRCVLERYVFKPVGTRYFGLRPRPPIPSLRSRENQRLLEDAFHSSRLKASHPNGDTRLAAVRAASCTGLSVREVLQWWRRRARAERPTTLDKFSESAWRCTFYAAIFAYGLWCLSDKPWLWDTMYCWENFPHHDMTPDMFWYYMIELGFYISLTLSQFLDVKRKDFWQMFVHHILTIMLMAFSWTCNFTRIGTLVMLLHDFADVPLEAAKMAKYVKRQFAADVLFAVFTLAWFVSRLGLYPYRVIYSTTYQATFVVEMFSAYYIFNSMLLALQVLHIFWTVLIIKVVAQAVKSRDASSIKDLRSEDESSTSDEKED